jgi:hypothetical protein
LLLHGNTGRIRWTSHGSFLALAAPKCDLPRGHMTPRAPFPVKSAQTKYMNSVPCPKCNSELLPATFSSRARAAFDFKTCLRRCEPCGIGVSNALNGATFIYRDPLDNLPAEVRDGAIWAIENSLNIRNRPSKKNKFSFSTSEDAITWTVFSYLQREKLLREAFSGLLSIQFTCEPVLLLWGCAVPARTPESDVLCRNLVSILKSLGETSQSYSEPDVIMDFGDEGLVLIEVKYKSGNDGTTPADKFTKYVEGSSAFRNADSTISSGLYEFTRNWRIGFDLSAGRAITLVNLVLASRSSESIPLESFSNGLAQDRTHQFRQIRWPDLLDQISLPDWLSEYADRRGIL